LARVDRQMREDRTIASGELPLQQPTLPLEPLPAPEPVSTPAPTESLPQVGEAFVERFDGSMDARWSVSGGWSSGDGMTNDWRRSPVEIAPGLLALKLQHGPESSAHKLASGELQSQARHRCGYFEVWMKVPRGAGLVTGFLSDAGQEGGTRPNEIDIGILGRNTRVAELTDHENGKARSKKVTLRFDAADDSHVYDFDWQPGHVRW
jgi:beta-glucanase (GH16 family)